MMDKQDILNRIIFVGGPPRSGTTFLARSLNLHPAIVTAIDDHVYESWGLYYYRTRWGLAQKLRTKEMSKEEIQQCILQYIVRENNIWGIAPSKKVASFPLASPPIRPDSSVIIKQDLTLMRHYIPLSSLQHDFYVCLKSPEISFVLPQLAESLPEARFIFMYRPVLEIAESMYRKGHIVRLPVYHKRWNNETDENGELVPPPGVPPDWCDLWKKVSDFQRCVVYAVSYLMAMVSGISRISPERVFVYDHTHLRTNSERVFTALADFLSVDSNGFQTAIKEICENIPVIRPDLKSEYDEIEPQINIQNWLKRAESLNTINR
jgi:hypothetical protein